MTAHIPKDSHPWKRIGNFAVKKNHPWLKPACAQKRSAVDHKVKKDDEEPKFKTYLPKKMFSTIEEVQ